MPTQVNTQRIAKNTILLYGRMLLILAVSLYTCRVVLNTLGVEDYCIYNVRWAIVPMFVCLNEPMVTSAQRCLTFEFKIQPRMPEVRISGNPSLTSGLNLQTMANLRHL